MSLISDRISPKWLYRTFGAALLLGAVAVAVPAMAATPSWTPKSSERLVKLPPSYLKKSLDHDFSQSALGSALTSTEEKIGLKSSTLGDIQKAIESSDGEVRLELRHQFLAEKRAYLEMMSERNGLRKKHLQTKRRLFENMIEHLAQEEDLSPASQELIAQQDAAVARFERTFAAVDRKVFETSMARESRYSTQFNQNIAAIDQLMSRINGHKMNASATAEEGLPMTKQEHLRRLAADVQAELSVVEQEETMLGYMAKLVALDAMALAEDGMDAEMADSDVAEPLQPAKSVSFFLKN